MTQIMFYGGINLPLGGDMIFFSYLRYADGFNDIFAINELIFAFDSKFKYLFFYKTYLFNYNVMLVLLLVAIVAIVVLKIF